ncbi:hypothetical protein [Lacticaseibacillus songhuajiangensis]|jgi:hypothetical protein|uniref:hypothetical protein n=1 Tax=Lacticaseibacillus songhuajiangensis TaxID=1296539 RepID=UPI000F765E7B|nr:hypothetical protein [Lacticaseibacillus songhuajiangensis]MCI1283923.1 hypothetical protein [Lacticaseibacillus songhuajiangensis]
MFDIFITVLDVVLFAAIGYNLYWQSQIEIRSTYAYWQMIWGIIIAIWLVSTGIRSWSYVVFLALFVLMNLSAGVGGLGSKKVVGNGFYSRFFAYNTFAGVTLTPISTPSGKNLVIAIFALEPRRYVRLTFRAPLEQIIAKLQQQLPESVPVTIQKIN